MTATLEAPETQRPERPLWPRLIKWGVTVGIIIVTRGPRRAKAGLTTSSGSNRCSAMYPILTITSTNSPVV